jgi:hypothetical protein
MNGQDCRALEGGGGQDFGQESVSTVASSATEGARCDRADLH